jgi:hypothetical protein
MKLNSSASDYANSKGGYLCTVRIKHKHRHQWTLGVSGEVVLEVTAEESKSVDVWSAEFKILVYS